jgi:GNAT superfamily N-acetyltransferase
MRIKQATKEHRDGIENILEFHLEREFHVPIDMFVDREQEPIGRVCLSDGMVVGLMGCYWYEDPGDLIAEIVNGVVKPSVKSFTDDKMAFLSYAYTHEEYRGEGIGTKLYENLIELSRREFGAEAVYMEAWIHGHGVDGEVFARSKGFDVFFWPQDYWGDDDYCSLHRQKGCECEGALFRKSLE